jgi:hypothetical protein
VKFCRNARRIDAYIPFCRIVCLRIAPRHQVYAVIKKWRSTELLGRAPSASRSVADATTRLTGGRERRAGNAPSAMNTISDIGGRSCRLMVDSESLSAKVRPVDARDFAASRDYLG